MTPARLVTGLITERGVLAATREALARAFPERAAGESRKACRMSSRRANQSPFRSTAASRRPRSRSRAARSACWSRSAMSCVCELPLASGRRADLVALRHDGEIWIVEIKSSIEDFRVDQKWPDYRLHCDRLFSPPPRTCRWRSSPRMPA